MKEEIKLPTKVVLNKKAEKIKTFRLKAGEVADLLAIDFYNKRVKVHRENDEVVLWLKFSEIDFKQ